MKKEQFELKSLKIDSSGKLEVIYHEVITGDSTAYSDEVGRKSPRIPHEDLKEALQDLAPYLADANDLRIHRKELKIMPALKKNLETKEMERLLKMWDTEINDSITVSGIHIQGDLDTGSCIITGKHKVHHTAVAMNSPKMSFNGDSFGFENAVKELIENIIDEAYEYVVNNKSAAPELFDDKKDDEEAA